MYFTLIGRSRKWIPSKASILISIISIVSFSTFGNAQNILDSYSRLSFSAGFEKVYGFEIDQLPFGLHYEHIEQSVPSIGIHYDIYRWENSLLRTGLRLTRIIEKEFVLLPDNYTGAPAGSFIVYIDTSTGFDDLRYELSLGYNYFIINKRTFAFYLGAEGIFGLGQNTYPSVLEIGFGPNETQLTAAHQSPSSVYGKLGVETGIKFATPHFLARINFFYHYRLQNMLEGHLVINNSNNELIEREYQLKGDSYGVSLMIYPKKRKKKVQ
ncbi:hypothetical protein [Luteirhabdus pelagi]|uniref:hypothetical protein n=1 Tax=Luteirhabdus pelagi TaxID=2792783 RepID=UPI0019396F6B|nr:hypothetical protein [Luteirhabdus pelagi]